MRPYKPTWTLWMLASLLAPDESAAVAAEPVQIAVTLDERAAAKVSPERPMSGRLYVFLSRREGPEPRFGPDWFAPEPFFGLDAHAFGPGQTRAIDDTADGFPEPLSRLPKGNYRAQALLDHQLETCHHAGGVGNLYSDVASWDYDPSSPSPLELKLERVVAPRPFADSEWVKEVVVSSELLSRFHGREVVERAAVVLPASYARRPERRYPVLFSVPGFGGDHRIGLRFTDGGPPEPQEGEIEFIRVMLSGDCEWGHHVYADSATNGPRGAALVSELIPRIDADFRTVAEPTARFLTGHSSGGWSSLWLQVTYPDTFGGVWSTSPDPVDFRDWQQVDLYADPPLSLYVDEQGERRPIARRGTVPVLWYESFAKMDDVLGRGGQLRSFEAVFSPLGEDGLPRRLWDRRSGRIDPAVANAWRRYDIRLLLERNWPELGPKLAGKLHVITGSLDTFYLDGAVRKLAEAMAALGSDAEITVVDGKDHGNLLTPELLGRIRRQMSEAFLREHVDK
ncbi:MAG TPA: alpha/beta hydrolase-fold protein [Pirellulales bacterium]|nr:alpha/beta hydrolase-fold protein [Pirellulales bacterium]